MIQQAIHRNRYEDIRRTVLLSQALQCLDQKTYLFREAYAMGYPKFTDVREVRPGQAMTAFVGLDRNGNFLFCWGRHFFDLLLDDRVWQDGSNPLGRIMFILAHETLHVVFRHITRAEGKIAKVWNYACLKGGSLVSMADGSKKPICDVRVGDVVLGVSPDGRVVSTPVLHSQSKLSDDLVEVTGANYSLTSTSDHEFLTEYGYVEAGIIGSYTESNRQVVRVREDVCAREHEYYVYRGVGYETSTGLPQRRRVYEAEWLDGDQNRHQISRRRRELYVPSKTEIERVELLCRTGGWGGAHFGLDPQEPQSQQGLLSANSERVEYFWPASRLALRTGFSLRRRVELQRMPSLEVEFLQHNGGTVTSFVDAVVGGQKSSSQFGVGVCAPSWEANLPGGAYGKDDFHCPRTADLERERVSVRAVSGSARVWDITTGTHNFIAEGFVVHNCDIVVNWYCEWYGLKLLPGSVTVDDYPEDWGIDPETQTTEQIYEILLKHAKVLPSFGPASGHHDQWEQLDERTREILEGKITEAQSKAANRDDDAGHNDPDSDSQGCGKLPGTGAAGELRQFADQIVADNRVPWDTMLRHRLGSLYQPHVAERWDRLPTRLTSQWGRLVLPSNRMDRKRTGIHILTALDASASMSEDDIYRMACVLASLPDNYKATLVSFDTKCYLIDSLEDVRGGGGTSLDDVDRVAEELEVDCVVCLTDGYFGSSGSRLTRPVDWVFIIDGTDSYVPDEATAFRV